MVKKVKSFFVDIFGFMSTFFTFIVGVETIFQIIYKNDKINISFLIFSFIVSISFSVVHYIIWYTNFFEKCSYFFKNLVQYILGLLVVCIYNDLTDIKRIAFLFLYYNIIYFGIYFLFMQKQKKDIDKLNKAIASLKDENDEK